MNEPAVNTNERNSGPIYLCPSLLSSTLVCSLCPSMLLIDYEFALLWSRWSGCRHYPPFNKRVKRSFVRILELVNILRQIPRRSAGASFLVQRLRMWSVLEFERAKTTLMRRTHWDIPLDGPFLSPILIWCQVPLENLSACFDPNMQNQIVSDKNLETHNPSGGTDPFAPPFFDFLLGFSSASTCRKWLLSPYVHQDSDLQLLTHGKMPISTWRSFAIFVLDQNLTPFLRAFISVAFFTVSLCLRICCGTTTIVLFVSDYCHCCQRLFRHDWNNKRLLWNIVHVPSTENTLTFLAAHTFLRFRLWVAGPLSKRSFRSLMFRVLFIWSIWSFTDVLNRK